MKITQIIKRDGKVVPFDQEKITNAIYKAALAVGGSNQELAEQISNKVVKILEDNFPDALPTVEEIQDVVERTLIKEGHDETAKAYITYRQKRKELREKKEKKEIENVPYKVIWQTLVWNLEHSCETIDKLNEHIAAGTFVDLIQAAEEKYDQGLDNVVEDFLEKEGVRLLIITGPSSSGKTTTTSRLSEKLKKHGFEFVKFTVDEYFYDLPQQIKDGFGDYDFEGPYALDLPLINQHLSDLVEGKKIKMPHYNFKTGRREENGEELIIKPSQVILIDSHFGIYSKVTESIPDDKKYKLYLETLCQLRDKNNRFVHWTDIRMLRRMIRDSQFRAYQPVATAGHWHYVRQGELKNIIPYISEADYVLDTSLAYELPVLKHALFHHFPKIIETYENNPDRQDAYIRAQRVYDLLNQITKWSDYSAIPKNSLMREFIGP